MNPSRHVTQGSRGGHVEGGLHQCDRHVEYGLHIRGAVAANRAHRIRRHAQPADRATFRHAPGPEDTRHWVGI